MCFTVQLSRFLTYCLSDSLFTLSHLFRCVKYFFQVFFKPERRRRDLNPRAAINDLLPFQGSPFGQLGYFSKLPYAIASHFFQKHFILYRVVFRLSRTFLFIFILNSGESGIRTHAPLRTNGFQDRLVMTTSISLLKRALLFYQSFLFLSRTFLKFFHRMF